MFKPSKKWIALLTSASLFIGTLNVCAAGTDVKDNKVYDDSSVGISSAVERYIEEKQSTNDVVAISNLTPDISEDKEIVQVSFNDTEEEVPSVVEAGEQDAAGAASEEVSEAEEQVSEETTTENKEEKTTEKVTEKATEKKTEATTEKATEKKTEATTEKATEKKTEKATEKATEKTSSSVSVTYDNFSGKAISTPSSLNIRSKADANSEKVGTIPQGGLCTVKDKGSEWTLIVSGKVKGYVKTEYLVFGKDAAKWAKNNGLGQVAVINASGLRVREEASDTSKVVSLAPKGEQYEIINIGKVWTKIEFDESFDGYVNNAYITISYKTKTAKAVEKKTEATTEKTTEKKTEKTTEKTTEKKTEKKTETTTEKATEKKTEKKTESETEAATEKTYEEPASKSKQDLVKYALQFVGNRYVYGGNSLTNGTDCSGFTMLIYRKWGVKLPHSAHLQANYGKEVPVSQAQPGDLIFYAKNGGINHVTIYIGNGQVVHASSPSSGIKISNYTYRQPVKCVRLID